MVLFFGTKIYSTSNLQNEQATLYASCFFLLWCHTTTQTGHPQLDILTDKRQPSNALR